MNRFLSESKNKRYWYILYRAKSELIISRAFDFFRKNGLEPILIKGWAAARFYPNFERQFTDIDFCVAPEDYEKARKILETDEGKYVQIDLHKGLRHLDKLPWEDLFANSELIPVNGVPFRVLRVEDHLRVLCVHWLTDGGAYKEKLLDIFYAIENRPENFDWERFLDSAGAKRRRWFLCCLGLAKRYYGLNLENTPVGDEVENIPEWIIETVEREWRDDLKLTPLESCMHDRKLLWRQIRKRIPPNPIQATVDLEGSFDDSPRIFYQIVDFCIRLMRSAVKNGSRIIKGK
jgi:hypothetical protein